MNPTMDFYTDITYIYVNLHIYYKSKMLPISLVLSVSYYKDLCDSHGKRD